MATIIFGATGGIGRAVCNLLHKRGQALFLVARDTSRLQAMSDTLEGAPFACADSADFAAVDAVMDQAQGALGGITGIAHCVGSLLLKPAHLTTFDDWHNVIQTNLTSAFAVVRAGARHMQTTGGAICLVSTVAARFGMANHDAIAAAKGGVQGLALAAAATYAARGIRINVVAPGLVETAMTQQLVASDTMASASAAMHPLGRIGQPEEVASAIAWFLDPEQAWVTGQILGVDGGLGSIRSSRKLVTTAR